MRPASLEELRACKQGKREALQAYIQRWTILKNSAEDISEESAIDAFRRGLQRVEFKEQLGQMKVRTLARLLELANSWADGEDSVRNETETHNARSEYDYDNNGDRGDDRRRKRPRRNFYNDRGPDMVAAGFSDDRNGRHHDDNRPQRRDNPEDEPQAQTREWRTRQPRDGTCAFRSAKEQLDGPCSLHGFRNERGELKSSHTLRNCRSFNELAEEKSRSSVAAARPLASIAVGPVAHGAPPAPPLSTRQVAAIQERQRTPEEENQYPEAHGRIYVIQEGRPSNRQQKQVTRKVFLVTSAHPAVPEYLCGSETEISFSRDDHLPVVPQPRHAALVLEARMGNYDMSRVFMDGGSGINIIFTRTLDDMLIQNNALKSSGTIEARGPDLSIR